MKKLSLIAAAALGALIACNAAPAQGGSKNPAWKGGKREAPNLEQRLERMTTQLKLTDAQKPKVKAVLEETAKKIKELKPEERPAKIKTLREEETKKLKAILTDEQFKKREEMMQRAREKRGPIGDKKARKARA